uniref:Ig-like domain-containing protein n=1 Tax=Pelusios castaneus TaxID=367368 RepID=A0A8C8S1K5_9SAUR
MERALLLPLLATHPAPTFALQPRKDEYLLGDTVSLMCSANPVGNQFPVFQFYNNMGWAATTSVSSSWKYTYIFNITEPRNAGSYSCSYYTGRPRNYIHSKESNHVPVRVKDPPPQPVLSMDPPFGVVIEGHPLHINCTAPGDTGERRFHFYKDGEELLSGAAGSEIMAMEPGNDAMKVNMLSISQAGPNSTGEFTCGYEENMGVRWIPSARSQPVAVTLKDPPPQPVLRVDPPTGEVRVGYPLLITCTAPGDAGERRLHFYKDGAKIVPGEARSEISLTETHSGSKNVCVLNNPRAGPDSAGEFTCGYEENVGGRWIPSPRSQPVTVTLKDPLPSPVLSVDPPSGAVTEGLPLLITCSAPGDASEWRFHFYKDGAELTAGDQGSEISPTEPGTGSMMLTFPRAGPGSAGEFTCGYEENMSGRWLPSPRSQAVTVSMKVPFDPSSLPIIPLVAGCSAAVVALILLLLLVCFCRRTKKVSKWQLRRRPQNDDSVSNYSPMPLVMINPDTL